ncbi:unnamed protein product [Effrenium voratum]|nr:unnamed protein product [Effrenium voratum]
MGGVVDRFWAQDDSPEVPAPLKQLQSWGREDLRHSFEVFRSIGGNAVNSRQLGQILRISNFSTTKEIFDLLIGPGASEHSLLDFWSVLGAMVVMSGQHYVSRVTFLFSMFDMDGDGSLNLSEVVIAVRTMFTGLARFCPKASLPDERRLEQLAKEMFERFDADGSGRVAVGEMVAYAYRSEGLLRLCEPFPAREKHVFEEPVRFFSKVAKAADSGVGLKQQLRLDPDAAHSASMRPRGYDKPWQRAAHRDGLTKAHAWVAWISFRQLAKKSNPRVIDSLELLNLVTRGRPRVFPLINAAVEESKSPAEQVEERTDELCASRIVMSVSQALLAKEVEERLRKMQGASVHGEESGHISLRSFLCLLWPKVGDASIECCVRWCQSFHAHQVCLALLRQKRASMCQTRQSRGSIGMEPASGRRPVALLDRLDRDDLKALFETLDIDGNLKLSARELCTQGGISAKEAQRLLRIWDQDNDGELSQAELSSIVHALDSALKQQVKGLFAAAREPADTSTQKEEATAPAEPVGMSPQPASARARPPPRRRRSNSLPPLRRGAPPALLSRTRVRGKW